MGPSHTRGKKPSTVRVPVPRRGGNGQISEAQASGSGSAQATSSNAGPAILDSATNFMMTGGQITAHQGDYTSVTININASRTSDEPVQIGNQAIAQNVAPTSATNPNRNRMRPEENMIRPIQRSNEVYERHLMLKGRGLPLWIPQPNIRLPIPYRAKGVCIGDVGIVTAFGGFDFLFNICRAQGDPINPEELPDGFAPINITPTDIREFREFSSGSYLASSSIVESQTGGQSPGLTFESSASEGAILTMPDGAFQEELGNLFRFRNYVAVHAANWYKFVNGPRGREAQNGDVRVVVGCDKSTSWGMATFANTSSTQQSKFRLKFSPLEGQQQPQHSAHVWEHSGIADVRVGPEPGENEELGETPSRQFRNQCLFMRTLSVALSDRVWDETFPGTASVINQQESQPEQRGQHVRPSNSNTFRASSSSSKPTKSAQGKRRAPGPLESNEEEKEDEHEDGPTSIHNISGVNPSSATINKLTPSSSGDHAGGRPTSETRNSDDIALNNWTELIRMVNDPELIQDVPRGSPSSAPAKGSALSRSPKRRIDLASDTLDSDDIGSDSTPVELNNWVNKLYHMVDDPKSTKCMWSNSGATFIISNVVANDDFSKFVIKLEMYGFHLINRISLLYSSTEEYGWQFFHPKFIRGRPDLLHEIHRDPTKNDQPIETNMHIEYYLSSTQLPRQLGARHNLSKIISKYLLDQVPYAGIALTHDRDWSNVTETTLSSLDPVKFLEDITFLNEVKVDVALGTVFLEPKNNISFLTDEEQAIIGQIMKHEITVEQCLFQFSENHSTLLRHLINQLRSDYMPFRNQYNIPTGETPLLLMGHPQRFLSLDDFVHIWQGNLDLALSHHHIYSVRSELNDLDPQDPDKGTWLLRLADALSRRFWELNRRDDVEEAIWYYEEAASLLPKTHYHFLETILGLCSSLYQRFRLLGHLDDLKKLLAYLQVEHNLDFEFLLTPVKAQLQDRPQQLANTLFDSNSELGNQRTMDEILNVPEALGNVDEWEAEEAGSLEDPSAPQEPARQKKFQQTDPKGSSGKSDTGIRRPKNVQTVKGSLDLGPSKPQAPVQNTGLESLDTVDEAIHDEV